MSSSAPTNRNRAAACARASPGSPPRTVTGPGSGSTSPRNHHRRATTESSSKERPMSGTQARDVRDIVSTGRMTPSQAAAVLVAIFLNTVDGYDVLVMAFTSTSVSREFGIGPGALGTLLSASLFGMAIGSIVIAPLADRIGRRTITLGALTVVTIFMAASALAPSALTLGIFRFLTGIGIGAMLPNLSTFVSEYSTRRWREPAVVLNSAGYAVGGTVGGFAAAALIQASGWRSAFWLGAAVGLVALIACWALVPESIHYLVERRPADALAKVNRVLAKMRREPVTELPLVSEHERIGIRDMFTGRLGRTTILLWVAFFGLMSGFYFANSWTPRLLNQSGLPENLSVIGGVLISLGGIVGALTLAALAIKLPAKVLEIAALIGSALIFLVFAASLSSPTSALITAVVVGFFINASVAGMYAVVATRYPPSVRSTGVGWAVGIGRVGAILAPLGAGAMLAAGWTPRQLFFVFAIPMVIAGIALLFVGRPVDSSAEVAAEESAPEPGAPLAPERQ
ncbi:MFS transporter [Enemella evansiae]|nr:MFS transporter [Enemella evansiae]